MPRPESRNATLPTHAPTPPPRSEPMCSIHDTFEAFAQTGRVEALEQLCRTRLIARPHLLTDRILLAMCLSWSRQDLPAAIEWDEAIHQAERIGDWEILQGCLHEMARTYPDEALSTLDHLSEAFSPMTRAWLKANLLDELGRTVEAEHTVLQAIVSPNRTTVRERGPGYGARMRPEGCDPNHLPRPVGLVS